MSSVRKTVSSIVCGLILAILVIVVKNIISPLLMQKCTFGMPHLIELGRVDNLYIGSSAFRQGIDIGVLEDNNSESSYILTYNANQPALEYLQLKHLLDKGVYVKHVFIDMMPYAMYWDPEIEDEKLIMESDIGMKRELYQIIPNKDLAFIFDYYISSYMDVFLTWPINRPLLSSQFYNGGLLTETNGISAEEIEKLSSPVQQGDFYDIQMDAVQNIIMLCKTNRIELTFVEVPKAGNVMFDDTYIYAMEKYENMLGKYEIEVIRSKDFDTMNGEYFQDVVHLSSKGRRVFTRDYLR